MGYDYFKGYTKEDAIKKAIADWHTDRLVTLTISYEIAGDVVWVLRSTSEKENNKAPYVWIECILLDYSPYGWGFKRLCEEMFPYYYDCPIEWLRVAPCACQEWRRRVFENYAQHVL